MHRHTKSGLFLIEMIIAIGFFSVASAVCVSLFVETFLKSSSTHETNMAIITTQSAAESFKASGGSPERTKELLSCEASGEDVLVLYYDNDWIRTGSDGKYKLVMQIDTDAIPASAIIEVFGADQAEPIHSLQAKKYVPS